MPKTPIADFFHETNDGVKHLTRIYWSEGNGNADPGQVLRDEVKSCVIIGTGSNAYDDYEFSVEELSSQYFVVIIREHKEPETKKRKPEKDLVNDRPRKSRKSRPRKKPKTTDAQEDLDFVKIY